IGRVQSAQLLSAAVGPAARGYIASHFGIRYAFFVTAGLCAVALIGLMVLFKEERPGEVTRRPAPLAFREVFRLHHFAVVLGLLLIAQFIDRGLALLIPLKVAHLPGVERIAAVSGIIISVSAVCGTISASVAGRLAQDWPIARLLLIACLTGAIPCALMAWTNSWVWLLVLRCLVGFSLGGALTLAYPLGGHLVPSDNRGAVFGWLALGVQFSSALSPVATGGLAALSLSGAFLFDGAPAGVGASPLLLAARDLIHRRLYHAPPVRRPRPRDLPGRAGSRAGGAAGEGLSHR